MIEFTPILIFLIGFSKLLRVDLVSHKIKGNFSFTGEKEEEIKVHLLLLC